MPKWRNGRRSGLKIRRVHALASSSLAPGTSLVIVFENI